MTDYLAVALNWAAPTFGAGMFAVAVTRAYGRDQNLIIPAAYQAQRVKERPPGPGDHDPDLAWAIYPYRQARADRDRLLTCLTRVTGQAWGPVRFFTGRGAGWWWFFLMPLLVIFFLISAFVTAWFCLLVYFIVNAAVSWTSLAVLALAGTALRGAERARRQRRLTRAACTRCGHVNGWPAFECPSCGQRHRDILPGRLGLLTRRCACGAHLPTMPSRAAWTTIPRCQRCDAKLEKGAGAVRDVRVLVFGDIAAGKTRFLYAALSSLMTAAQNGGRTVAFSGDGSQALARSGLDVIRTGQDMAKAFSGIPVTLTFRLGKERKSDLVRILDASGDYFRSPLEPDSLRFLDEGHGLVYVLDPFSVEGFTSRLGEHDGDVLAHIRAASGDPELSYNDVVSWLRDAGVPPASQVLSVVVSKADLLRSAGLDVPADSDAIARWLEDSGVHNLVTASRLEFADVRFFAIASQDIPPGGPGDPGAPLRWLLASRRIRLPLEASA